MKKVSVADAKNRLPALLHQAERAPIEIQRRGKAVAVIVSSASYERMRGGAVDAWSALERFRATHDLGALDLEGAFEGTRAREPGGQVRW